MVDDDRVPTWWVCMVIVVFLLAAFVAVFGRREVHDTCHKVCSVHIPGDLGFRNNFVISRSVA